MSRQAIPPPAPDVRPTPFEVTCPCIGCGGCCCSCIANRGVAACARASICTCPRDTRDAQTIRAQFPPNALTPLKSDGGLVRLPNEVVAISWLRTPDYEPIARAYVESARPGWTLGKVLVGTCRASAAVIVAPVSHERRS